MNRRREEQKAQEEKQLEAPNERRRGGGKGAWEKGGRDGKGWEKGGKDKGWEKGNKQKNQASQGKADFKQPYPVSQGRREPKEQSWNTPKQGQQRSQATDDVITPPQGNYVCTGRDG